MLRSLAAAALVLGYTVSCGGAALAADAVGTWLTEDGKARVHIIHCGGAALCGAISWLREPTDPETGGPKTDIHNSDAAFRNRPLVGTQILLGMTPTGEPDKWEGKVYNAEDGDIYTAYLTMLGPSSLKLQGCVLGGLICKGQTWSRTE